MNAMECDVCGRRYYTSGSLDHLTPAARRCPVCHGLLAGACAAAPEPDERTPRRFSELGGGQRR